MLAGHKLRLLTWTRFIATTDRLISTKEEVTMLRNRFDEELGQQAAAARKMMNMLTSSKDRSAGKEEKAVCPREQSATLW